MLKEIDAICAGYQTVTLNELESVKLMNRIDSKFILDVRLLPVILKKIMNDYHILQIGKQKVFPYRSLYYDTENNFMYLAHHNGIPRRYKIRFREYLSSNLCFLEIKYKAKGNRTIKNRTPVSEIETTLSDAAINYIAEYTPFHETVLEPKIYTNFSRITLVNNSFSERVTIDLGLHFKYDGQDCSLDNVIILEIKRDATSCASLLINTLKYHRVSSGGFSKYCLGRALTEDGIKKNNFKANILTINKINDGNYYFSNFNQH